MKILIDLKILFVFGDLVCCFRYSVSWMVAIYGFFQIWLVGRKGICILAGSLFVDRCGVPPSGTLTFGFWVGYERFGFVSYLYFITTNTKTYRFTKNITNITSNSDWLQSPVTIFFS